MPKKLTKEEFIKKSREKHGDKYNYDKVDYKNNRTKVCIICPEHGEFWQTPNSHIRGCGCQKCMGEANGERYRLSREDFIKKANKIHHNKYNYSKVNYDGAFTKVCIICKEHGEFWQTPSNHTQGQGCSKCKGDKTRERFALTKKEFIKRANEKHGDKYNYDKVEYHNANTKVCIICPKPEHGEFWQVPSSHLNGNGCPKCRNDSLADSRRLPKEEFVKKSNNIHDGKYNYDKVEYVNAHTKVCIICPEHGEFWQIPKNHAKGVCCPKCSGKHVPTTEEWIASAREIHGDKYNYSKVKYEKAKTKVCIICPEHGEFWQTPYSHTKGQGCLKCNLSHLERSVMIYLDEVGITYDYQKRFDWLGLQSLDFYLPDYNVGIECQGRQHFFPVEHFGGDKGFKKILGRDKQKKALCEKHGIKLLYFGNVPNYDTFLGEAVRDDVQYLIDYLNEHKKKMIVE